MDKWITTTDQVKIYYSVCGHGPALIFLHGNLQTGRVFKKQVAYFSKKYTCLTIDTRAHGRSFFDGERLVFSRLAQDVFDVMNQEHLQKADLIGFSDGANIAMVLASEHPDRFSRLVLNAGNLTTKGIYFALRFFFFVTTHLLDWLKISRPTLQLLTQNTGLEMSDLSRITAQTLILIGQFDVVKYAHAYEMSTFIPDSKLIVAPLATHLFFYFQPKRFNKLIDQFLS